MNGPRSAAADSSAEFVEEVGQLLWTERPTDEEPLELVAIPFLQERHLLLVLDAFRHDPDL
jgi:hypothetical protein